MQKPIGQEFGNTSWRAALASGRTKLGDHRNVLLAVGIILILAVVAFDLPLGIAILGFIIVLGSSLIGSGALRAQPNVEPDPVEDQSNPGTSVIAVANALRSPAFIVDLQGIVCHANTAGRKAFPAVKTNDPLTLTLRSPLLGGALEEVSATGQGTSIEYLDRGDADRVFTVDIELLQDSPKPRFLLLNFEDVTDRLAIARMRADFVANASHELRTPLASLTGFIETLRGPARDDPEATSRFLSIMLEQAERMRRLIDDLLSLSRVEMRAHQPPTDSVDIVDVVAHVADALKPLADELNVNMTLNTDLAENPRILGDRDELIQVFENLIENGLRYGGIGGVLRIRISTGADHAEPRILVEIADKGPGIATEDLPRLTERFYRVDLATSRAMKGTGLGLAIVKHILTRHRAHLLIESTPGEGACFTVDLPAA